MDLTSSSSFDLTRCGSRQLPVGTGGIRIVPLALYCDHAEDDDAQPTWIDMAFTDTLKTLPGISHLTGLQLVDTDNGAIVHTLANKPGQAGSVAVYNALSQIFGAITPEAAQHGLLLYGEHTDDARAHPGKHPNVDRLIELSRGSRTLRVVALTAR